MTAQSERPNTRANVASSVPLGSGEWPGCVCIQSRANCLRPSAGIDLVVKEVGHRLVIELDHRPRAGLHDELHVFDEQQVVLRRRSQTRRSRVSPASRRNRSLAQAVGLNRSTVGRRAQAIDSCFGEVFFMAIGTPFVFVEAAGANARLAAVTGREAGRQ